MAFAIPVAALLATLATPSAVLTVGGLPIPLSALGHFPNVLADVIEHQPAIKTLNDALPIAEAVSDIFFPGSGIAEALVIYVIENQKPYTQADRERWWARAQGCESGSAQALEMCAVAYGEIHAPRR